MSTDELKKQAQAYLAQASECLQKAAELAEQGGFNISFRDGGTYVPSAAFDKEKLRAEAIEYLQKDEYPDGAWDEFSDEEKNELIEGYSDDCEYDMRPYYADCPGWWQPSRNC